jgi:hypothetical protein
LSEIKHDISIEHKMGQTAKLKAWYYSCDLAQREGSFILDGMVIF